MESDLNTECYQIRFACAGSNPVLTDLLVQESHRGVPRVSPLLFFVSCGVTCSVPCARDCM